MKVKICLVGFNKQGSFCNHVESYANIVDHFDTTEDMYKRYNSSTTLAQRVIINGNTMFKTGLQEDGSLLKACSKLKEFYLNRLKSREISMIVLSNIQDITNTLNNIFLDTAYVVCRYFTQLTPLNIHEIVNEHIDVLCSKFKVVEGSTQETEDTTDAISDITLSEVLEFGTGEKKNKDNSNEFENLLGSIPDEFEGINDFEDETDKESEVTDNTTEEKPAQGGVPSADTGIRDEETDEDTDVEEDIPDEYEGEEDETDNYNDMDTNEHENETDEDDETFQETSEDNKGNSEDLDDLEDEYYEDEEDFEIEHFDSEENLVDTNKTEGGDWDRKEDNSDIGNNTITGGFEISKNENVTEEDQCTKELVQTKTEDVEDICSVQDENPIDTFEDNPDYIKSKNSDIDNMENINDVSDVKIVVEKLGIKKFRVGDQISNIRRKLDNKIRKTVEERAELLKKNEDIKANLPSKLKQGDINKIVKEKEPTETKRKNKAVLVEKEKDTNYNKLGKDIESEILSTACGRGTRGKIGRQVLIVTGHSGSGVSMAANLMALGYNIYNNDEVLVVDFDFLYSTTAYNYELINEPAIQGNIVRAIAESEDMNTIDKYIVQLPSGVHLLTYLPMAMPTKYELAQVIFKCLKRSDYTVIIFDIPSYVIGLLPESFVYTASILFMLKGNSEGVLKGLYTLENLDFKDILGFLANTAFVGNLCDGKKFDIKDFISDNVDSNFAYESIPILGSIPKVQWDYQLKTFIKLKQSGLLRSLSELMYNI